MDSHFNEFSDGLNPPPSIWLPCLGANLLLAAGRVFTNHKDSLTFSGQSSYVARFFLGPLTRGSGTGKKGS